MNRRPLRPWVRLTTTWWIVTTLWWAMSDSRIGATVATLFHRRVAITPLNSGLKALDVILSWSAPVIGITLAGASVGAGVAWLSLAATRFFSGRSTRPSGEAWRGVTLSMGALEIPKWARLRTVPVKIQPRGMLARRLQAMSQAQGDLFVELIERIAAAPEAFVGDGHGGTLLDHTWHVISRLPDDSQDPLLPIAAAAHDVGKILAWRRELNGSWKRVGMHDDLGGMILSGCPSFEHLSENEARMLVCLLRFAHKRERTPLLPSDEDNRRLRRLGEALAKADGRATAVEKQRVLVSRDRPTILREAFLNALPKLPFQTPGTRTGAPACGWRKGSRVYFSEWGLREALKPYIEQIDRDAAAAWDARRQPGELAGMTQDLLALFADEAWLVRTVNGVTADPPLWNIRSGTKDLNGMILLDLPADMRSQLPADAPYRIEIVGPVGGQPFERDQRPMEPRSKYVGSESALPRVSASITSPAPPAAGPDRTPAPPDEAPPAAEPVMPPTPKPAPAPAPEVTESVTEATPPAASPETPRAPARRRGRSRATPTTLTAPTPATEPSVAAPEPAQAPEPAPAPAPKPAPVPKPAPEPARTPAIGSSVPGKASPAGSPAPTDGRDAMRARMRARAARAAANRSDPSTDDSA